MTAFILRHGESDGNDHSRLCPPDSESGLTSRGRDQIVAACKTLASLVKKPARICAGPALRTIQSAQLMSQLLKMEMDILQDLREIHQINVPQDHQQIHHKILEFWTNYYKSDEPDKKATQEYSEVQRIITEMRAAELQDRDLILVTHGGKSEMLLNTLFGALEPRQATVQYSLSLGGFHMIDLIPAETGLAHINILGLNVCGAII